MKSIKAIVIGVVFLFVQIALSWGFAHIEYVYAENITDESEKDDSEKETVEETQTNESNKNVDVILPIDENEWNLLHGLQMLEDSIVEANTGNIIEKEGYAAFVFIEIAKEGACALYLPDGNNVHITYYNEQKQYIGGEIVSAPRGKLLELPEECRYLTVSIAENELENSFLVQNEKAFVKIVSKEGECYSSIKKAVASIKEAGVVVVLPGTYDGNVKAWGKNVQLIGTDRFSCILQYDSGSYSFPPLEMGAGCIRNMTIKTNGGLTPVEKAGAYAVHVEDNALFNNKLIIENCYIESEHNSALGMGMRGGCNVQLKNVTLKGRDYGLFCHDSAYTGYTGVQNLSLIKCVIEGTHGDGAMRFDSQGVNGAKVNLLFVDNYLKNDNNKGINTRYDLLSTRNMYGKGNEENWMGLKNFYLDEDSMGNNLLELDY